MRQLLGKNIKHCLNFRLTLISSNALNPVNATGELPQSRAALALNYGKFPCGGRFHGSARAPAFAGGLVGSQMGRVRSTRVQHLTRSPKGGDRMTIQYELTDDYPQDIDQADPFRPEQPPTRFKYTDEETLAWARGLRDHPSGPHDHEAPEKQLRNTRWWSSQVSHRLRLTHGAIDNGAEDEALAEVMRTAIEFERACEEFLQIKGSST